MTYTIEEIKALLEAAIPGDWEFYDERWKYGPEAFRIIGPETDFYVGREKTCWRIEHAKLIKAAPTIIRELLDALEKAKHERNVARKEVQACNRETHGKCGND